MWNLVSGKGWMKNSETSCWLLASLALSSLRKSRNEDCPNGFSIAYSFKYRSIFKYRKLSFSFEVLNQYSCSPSGKDWFWSLMRRIKFELIMQSVVLLRWSSRRDLPAAHSQVLPTDLLAWKCVSVAPALRAEQGLKKQNFRVIVSQREAELAREWQWEPVEARIGSYRKP